MKILTGNDLATGDVIWWAGDAGWSRHVADSLDVGDKGDEIGHIEESARRVTAPYVIDAEKTADGVRPAHIKDRIRAIGPTVRLDLSIKPVEADIGNWVI